MDYMDKYLSSNDSKEIMFEKVLEFIIGTKENQDSDTKSKRKYGIKKSNVKENTIGDFMSKTFYI